MTAFFILPDARAGDTADEVYIGGVERGAPRVTADQIVRMETQIEALRARNDQLYGACKSDLEAFNRIVALVDDIRNGADLYNMLDLIIDLASMPAARAALSTGRRAETAALLERTGM